MNTPGKALYNERHAESDFKASKECHTCFSFRSCISLSICLTLLMPSCLVSLRSDNFSISNWMRRLSTSSIICGLLVTCATTTTTTNTITNTITITITITTAASSQEYRSEQISKYQKISVKITTARNDRLYSILYHTW